MEKVKVRESNIELLRNISMFMILVIHANFVSLPKIGYDELMSNTTPSVFRNQLQVTTTPKLIKRLFTFPKWADLSFFLLFAIINTIMIVFLIWRSHNIKPYHGMVFAYSNPMNILGGLYLFLFFL